MNCGCWDPEAWHRKYGMQPGEVCKNAGKEDTRMRKSGPRDEPEERVWKMPKWMEPFRKMIVNTGGNAVEELMNDHDSTQFNNVIRAGLCVCVDSQVSLLTRLASAGKLIGVDPETLEES